MPKAFEIKEKSKSKKKLGQKKQKFNLDHGRLWRVLLASLYLEICR